MDIYNASVDFYLISLICFSVITKERFLEIRSDLIEIFPAEDPEVYYIPPIPKTPGRKDSVSIDAQGKLYLRYRNELKRLRSQERALGQESMTETESSVEIEGD